MAITVETRTEIIELVVGMVGAAPGANILSELADIVDGGLSLNDLAIALANNPAFKTLYPTFLTNEEFATNYLTELLGAEVDATTLATSIDAMVADLNGGLHRGAAMYKAITTLSDFAEDDASFGNAAAALNNKVEVAIHYSVTTQQSADTLGELVAVVSSVDSTQASVDAAIAVNNGTNNKGGTFTLTTAVDAITGTTGNDTFIAVRDDNSNPTVRTINLGDFVDGGAGTDTLKIATDADDLSLGVATIENVEHLRITDANDELDTVSLGSNAGFLTATFIDMTDGDVDINDVMTSTAITFIDSDSDIDIQYTDEAGTDTVSVTFAGTDSNSNVNIDNIETINFTAAEGVLEEDVNLSNLNFGDADNLNIQADTDLNITNIDVEADAAITIAGAGDVNIANALEDTEITLDASAMTGDLTVIAGAHNVSITTGSGDDTVTTGAVILNVDLGAGDDVFDTNGFDYGVATAVNVDGGDGRDSVIIDDGTNLTTAAAAHFVSIEVLDVAGGTGTYDLDGFDFDGVDASADIGVGPVTINNITDEELSITGDQTGEIIYNLDDASGTSDELTLTVEGSSSFATDEIVAGDVTINGIETINLVSNQTVTTFALYRYADNVISVLDSDDADTLVITGNETLTITDFETGAGVNTTIETIDASGASAFQMGSGVSTANVSILGSAGRDVLVVGDVTGLEDGDGDGTGSTINAGTGGDQVTYTDTGAVDTYILNAGDSLLGFFDDFLPADTAGDGVYDEADDLENFDIITGFASGEDTLDLGSFGFTGQKASALAGPTLSAAGLLALVNGTTTSITDFFVDTGVTRGVAVVQGIDTSTVGGAAGSSVVFIDTDGDGSFNVANDDVVVLSGTATVALADIGF